MNDKIKDNEKIARFMGGYCHAEYNLKVGMNLPFINENDPWFDYKDMEFHKLWDWLMPVVAKCNDVCKEIGYPDDLELPGWHIMSVACNIKLVYISVIDFIDWYNEQNEI